MTNVIHFPEPLAAELLAIERELNALAVGRDIPPGRIRAALERVRPLHEALFAQLQIEIPDTEEDRSALQRIEEPLKQALLKRFRRAIVTQMESDLARR